MRKGKYYEKRQPCNKAKFSTSEETIKIAKELGYDETIIDRLSKATSEHEVSRILAEARRSV